MQEPLKDKEKTLREFAIRRFLARWADAGIFLLIFYFLMPAQTSELVSYTIGSIGYVTWEWVQTMVIGTTLAKRVVGLKLTSADGRELSSLAMLKRSLLVFIFGLTGGIIIIAPAANAIAFRSLISGRNPIWDDWASTRVVPDA